MPLARQLSDIGLHDPFILPDPDTGLYYLYSAYDGAGSRYASDGLGDERFAGNGVLAWRSENLRDWSDPEPVFVNPSGVWSDPSRPPWAPEVHRYRGRYYLFMTLHQPAEPLPSPHDGALTFVLQDGDGQDFRPVRRGTVVAVADHPLGPFELLDADGAQTPPDFVALDGTLYVDPHGRPWLVYAHEWVQLLDGTIEAVPLTDDLAAPAGPPVHLFRASSASWLDRRTPSSQSPLPYVTDGPSVRTLPGGALAMLWASYRRDGGPTGDVAEYVQTYALSPSGELAGPWQQQEILVAGNVGHGSLFETFEGTLMLVLHHGMGTPRVRARLYEIEESADGLRATADRVDLYAPDDA